MSMDIFSTMNFDRLGYRFARAVRAELDRAIRKYESEHVPLEEQARIEFREAYNAAGETSDDAPVVLNPTTGDVVPLHAAVVKNVLDEARGEIESGDVRGLILFKCYVDGGHSHMSVSKGGCSIGPADFALAGAALTQVGLQRAGWAAPAGDAEEEDGGA